MKKYSFYNNALLCCLLVLSLVMMSCLSKISRAGQRFQDHATILVSTARPCDRLLLMSPRKKSRGRNCIQMQELDKAKMHHKYSFKKQDKVFLAPIE